MVIGACGNHLDFIGKIFGFEISIRFLMIIRLVFIELFWSFDSIWWYLTLLLYSCYRLKLSFWEFLNQSLIFSRYWICNSSLVNEYDLAIDMIWKYFQTLCGTLKMWSKNIIPFKSEAFWYKSGHNEIKELWQIL